MAEPAQSNPPVEPGPPVQPLPAEGPGDGPPGESPAPSPARPGGKWQFPLLILGLILLLTGLPLLWVEPAEPDVETRLSQARQALAEEDFERAISDADRLVGRKLEGGQRAQAVLIRALSRFGQAANSRETARRVHAAEAVLDLNLAVTAAGTVEGLDPTLVGPAQFLARRGQAHLWVATAESQASGEADLLAAFGRLEPGQDALRKQLIELLWHLNPARVHEQLDRMMAREDLSPTDRVWAVRRKARLLGVEGRLNEAQSMLDKALASAAGPTRDALEVELARIHFQAVTDRYRPLSPGERTRRLDQACLLLEAVRLRSRPMLAGEDEIDGELHWLLGEVNLLQDRPAQAEEAFDRVIRLYPNGPHGSAAQLGVARAAALYERFDRALEAYRQVVEDLRLRPDEPLIDRAAVQDSLLALAEQLRRQERWEPAYRFLALLYEMLSPSQEKPSPADVREKQGLVLRNLATEEKQLAERISSAAPGERPETQPDQVGQLNAQACRHFAMAAEAYLDAARLISQDDHRSGNDLELAATCYDEAGELTQAIRVLRRFIREYPREKPRVARAVFNLAKAHQAAGQYDQAVATYRRMIEEFFKSPDANRSLVPLAQCYKATGRLDEAENMLSAVLHDDELFTPDSAEYAEALFELAKLKYEQGQYRQAIARFDEALQRNPNHRTALYSRYYLADSYRLSGLELDGAIASAQTPLQRQQLVQTRTAWLSRARELFDTVVALLEGRSGRVEELDRLYLRNSYFFRADCLFDLGRYDEAIWMYDLAGLKYSTEPEAVAAYVQIVNCYHRMGKPGQARTANERAKWLLRRLAPETFASRPLPLDREYFAQWLEWAGQPGRW